MKSVSEKPRKVKGESCEIASIRKRHEDFIRELQAPLMPLDSHDKQDERPDVDAPSDDSISDKQLTEELQRKFNKLFGVDDSDD